MKTSTLFTTIVSLTILAAPSAFAEEMRAREGLDKLKTNLANSKGNLEQYEANLKIVDENLGEVKKSVAGLLDQEAKLQAANSEHQKDAQKLTASENEYQRLVKEENQKRKVEQDKLAELEKLKTQLQAQLELRTQNMEAYQKELTAVAEQKKNWSLKKAEFEQANKKLKSERESLSAKLKEQTAKRKGYEVEIARWKKEVDRQDKVVSGFSALAPQ